MHMQGSVCVQSEDTLLLKAPKDSHSMKSAERGVSQSVHKFTFSRVYTHTCTHQNPLSLCLRIGDVFTEFILHQQLHPDQLTKYTLQSIHSIYLLIHKHTLLFISCNTALYLVARMCVCVCVDFQGSSISTGSV